MAEPLTIVASLFTIWAQASILSENGEFEQFKNKQPPAQEEQINELEQRRLDIIKASLMRRQQIYANNAKVISQTRLGER